MGTPVLIAVSAMLIASVASRIEPSVVKSTNNLLVDENSKHKSTPDLLVHESSDYKVVCYFISSAWFKIGLGKFDPSNIDPDLCTHIIYGHAVLNSDEMIIKSQDAWTDFYYKLYARVTAFKAKGVKVLLSFAGWNDSGDGKYSKLVNSPSARSRFISNVLQFLEENNFDGLDLDWEFPKCWQADCKGPASDKPAFAQFVQELHAAFKPRGLLLSAVVSRTNWVIDAAYDVSSLSLHLDWITVMCYNYHGSWEKTTGHTAPLYATSEDASDTFNVNFTINYWINKGAARKKLVLGIPMFGQSFTLEDKGKYGLNAPAKEAGEAGDITGIKGFLAYYEVCYRVKNEAWHVVREKISPYAYVGDQWASFDDVVSVGEKSHYIKDMGLGGGMIWSLDLDDFKNVCGDGSYPLLKTINRVLRPQVYGKKPVEPKPAIEPIKPGDKPRGKALEEPRESNNPPKTCDGKLFLPDEKNCNRYYICKEGFLKLRVCPEGLYWNEVNCDYPQNTKCPSDSSKKNPGRTSPRPVYNFYFF